MNIDHDKLLRKLTYRRGLLWLLLILAFAIMVWRAYKLQIMGEMQLFGNGHSIVDTDAARERERTVEPTRGNITDRNGELLAISAPIASVWTNPQKSLCGIKFLAQLHGISPVAVLASNKVRQQLQNWRQQQEEQQLSAAVDAKTAMRILRCGSLAYVAVYDQTASKRYRYISNIAAQERSHPNSKFMLKTWRPQLLAKALDKQLLNVGELAKLLKTDVRKLVQAQSEAEPKQYFSYIKRQMALADGYKVAQLKVDGISSKTESRRYYPGAEVTAQILGFVTEQAANRSLVLKGQTGIEGEYNSWLAGKSGVHKVVVDGLGNDVATVEWERKPEPGQDIQLSIDLRLQYFAYRALKKAVLENQAKSGSAVILDARNGQILALVNQPSFNPNNRQNLKAAEYVNRAISDVFEPGSTMKPFSLAMAMEAGVVNRNSIIDTSPGVWKITGSGVVRDKRDYGRLSLTDIIKHSSNVGTAKVLMRVSKDFQYQIYRKLGFGEVTNSGFVRANRRYETAGILNPPRKWSEFERATMSFGYGLSVSTLQLAQAYLAIANDGVRVPLSIFTSADDKPAVRVFSAKNARAVRQMMESVVMVGGTAPLAKVKGYSIAGKTGTAYKAVGGGYSRDKYSSVFAGIAPAAKPRLVMVVMIDDSQGKTYGGQIAAPVFATVMRQALRILNVPPDDLRDQKIIKVAQATGAGS